MLTHRLILYGVAGLSHLRRRAIRGSPRHQVVSSASAAPSSSTKPEAEPEPPEPGHEPLAPPTASTVSLRRIGDAPASAEERGREGLVAVLRPLVAFLANVTVLTALLVYFGWRRSETQAQRLGIDESILGMSTREYVLRSVGPVLILLVGISVAGLLWVALERRLAPLLRPSASGVSGLQSFLFRLFALAWLILPLTVWMIGFVWRTQAYILFPASIGAGVLLMLYGAHMRRPSMSVGNAERRRHLARDLFGALLVGVCLFWTASTYAEVLGVELARDFAGQVDRLVGVVVHSEKRLFLDGPGVTETPLPGGQNPEQYRYSGLRLLEHTGGKYFLISDEWTRAYGVVFALPDDEAAIRVDFVRDNR